MEIFYKDFGPVSTNAIIIMDKESHECVIIDAPLDSAETLIHQINKMEGKVKALWLTHSHWDHTGNAQILKESLNIPVYVHKADEYRMLNQEAHKMFPLPFDLENCTPDFYIEDKQKLKLGKFNFEVVHTPGHTEGSVCFIEHQFKLIVAGDTLFNASIGRTDLPGGNFEQLITSINEKLLILPDDYNVICGHGPKTTIGFERLHNPFLS